MTYDQSDSKFWFNGEYEPLDSDQISDKLRMHELHCPIGTNVGELIHET